MELTTLNKLRKEKRIKITYISKVTGISKTTISSILNGNVNSKFKYVEAVANCIGVSIECTLDWSKTH